MDKDRSWIVLSYKVPSEPSTIRVRVWRTLKALGAVYIQQSVCVAPITVEVLKKLQSLKKLIESNEGEALLLEVNKFSPSTEEELIVIFNNQRIAEYEEFLEGSRNFLNEIETETKKGKFTYHEVEENEAELAKLKRWHNKILKRDFFSCTNSIQAKQKLNECEQRFGEFIETVYATEGQVEGEVAKDIGGYYGRSTGARKNKE
ncbi:Chromate resistance protein ChrB [Paenibacillus sp. UNC451MF]|uniref:Chromate resistance protein ChrB n=1 Tax=Paenibacillus sp. UNC451MF TaxID=1449063 RepID=UPI00068EC5EE|nr:Chromate resistance protein ChrB [Paenibacillus sp. UNC451MF]